MTDKIFPADVPGRILALARENGFEYAAAFDASGLVFLDEVRAMCAADRCRRYNKSWACPPACGSVGALERRARAYSRGVLVQTVAELDGDFDAEGLAAAERLHKRRFASLSRQAKLLAHGDCLPMGAGSCMLCVKCTYPSRPCRHPERVYPSMEAYGLIVADVCKLAGLRYYYGPGSISYASCILFNQGE